MAKIKTGLVVSNKMNQTVIVRIDRMVPHQKYGKRYRVSERFAAHDPSNSLQIGEHVTIREIRPMSKTKSWEVVGKTQESEK